ncbi:MAG: three-Cys-motif partner protein TcmP [Melioribacteraceae bacterium]|nr:MAG: three-Cys-motif partner protein TcmP [Melioribacteraceae bacterium]
MNQFGGDWTEKKIEILVEYAGAYLQIMKAHPYWKQMYFDGFAGSGFIFKETDLDILVGAALRIISIENPKSFDEFYFVEKKKKNFENLRSTITQQYPNKTVHFVREDCNNKLIDLSDFLKTQKGKNYKILAYIDPCGMQLNWESIESFADVKGIDVWVLVPTGLGVNRLLKRDGNISEEWLEKLKNFLGLPEKEIIEYFYHEEVENTLFGEISKSIKETKAIEKSAVLYKKRLKEVFEFVTEPFILKNKVNSTMFHYYMCSQNKTAYKIASDIIKKYNKMI